MKNSGNKVSVEDVLREVIKTVSTLGNRLSKLEHLFIKSNKQKSRV